MSRLIKTLIAASVGVGALLAVGCATVPGQASHGPIGAGTAAASADHHCMMMRKPGGAAGDQAMQMDCKMDCKCPMMQKHDAADAPSAPSVAPQQEHQHTPDTPPAQH